jgi:hypothetical protein
MYFMTSTDEISPNDQNHSTIYSLNEELSQLEMGLVKLDAPGKKTIYHFQGLLT